MPPTRIGCGFDDELDTLPNAFEIKNMYVMHMKVIQKFIHYVLDVVEA